MVSALLLFFLILFVLFVLLVLLLLLHWLNSLHREDQWHWRSHWNWLGHHDGWRLPPALLLLLLVLLLLLLLFRRGSVRDRGSVGDSIYCCCRHIRRLEIAPELCLIPVAMFTLLIFFFLSCPSPC